MKDKNMGVVIGYILVMKILMDMVCLVMEGSEVI